MTSGLRLLAQDAADLAIISAMLQDAIIPLEDMLFEKREGRFTLVANRFRWEGEAMAGGAWPSSHRTKPLFERVNAAVVIEHVTAVAYRGFDPRDRQAMLALLAIQVQPAQTEGTEQTLTLDFSGISSLMLKVSALSVALRDLGEPWPTHCRPGHEHDA
jgi:Protein of unknown function (DUF2948)